MDTMSSLILVLQCELRVKHLGLIACLVFQEKWLIGGKKCSTYAHLPSYYISMLHDELKRGTRKIDVMRSLGCFLLLAIRGRISIVVELKERKMTPTEGCHVTERRFAFDHRL